MSRPDDTSLRLGKGQAEDRIRTTLGLGQNASPSRQFDREPNHISIIRNGQIPVSTPSMHHSSETAKRLTEIEVTLKVEKNERIAAQRALAEARKAIQHLQTKLAHTEMAAAEVLAHKELELLSVHARIEELVCAFPHNPEVKKRGRPLGHKPPTVSTLEPKPVKWWLPAHRLKNK
jgi:hypothetical protein